MKYKNKIKKCGALLSPTDRCNFEVYEEEKNNNSLLVKVGSEENKEIYLVPHCIGVQARVWCTLLAIKCTNHSHIGLYWGQALLT